MKKTETLRQKEIRKVLEVALLSEGELSHRLYEYELVEHLNYWRAGLKRDGEDFVFVVTVNTGEVAMLAIHKNGDLMINEVARAYIKGVWQENYQKNMQMLIPQFVEDLDGDCFALTGVKIIDPRWHNRIQNFFKK